MKNIIKLTLVLLVLGCSRNNKPKFQENLIATSLKVNLKFHSIVNNSYLLNDSKEMFVTDSLVIVNSSDYSSFCQIFNKFSGEHIGGYFKKGQGPFEITIASSMSYSKKEKILSVYDANIKKIIYFKIDNLKQPIYKEIKLTNSHYKNHFVLQTLQVSDGSYVTRGNTSKARFGLVTKNKGSFIKNLHIDYPKIADDAEVNQALFSYASKWAIKPDNTKLVTTTYIGCVLEIFDYKNQKLTPVNAKYVFEPVYNIINSTAPKWVSGTKETKRGVKALSATNKGIFCILEGIIDYTNGPELNSVFSLDWEGNFLKEYKFSKGIFPISIAFDEESQKLYCITLSKEGEYAFNRYSL